ncbi:conserved hypothetical protein [Stigmatella aurantiaca DW4/3-1]|uniref:DUF2520 domain-containing protein n=1 Tax=Stigmatella aurantiaca (strain DW4/3-1) TaxID=378806 RepID=Q09AW4_STIAD|nr:conserved hypothetical protein [Stigmatella aurantiaca DW4/3-1]
MLSRTEAGRGRLKALGLKPATDKDVHQARVCLLCVPDSAVPEVAQEMDRQLGRGAALVHCAGALSLDALGTPKGRPLGSFHPLCAVSDPRDTLAGHTVALSTRSRTLKTVLRGMADDLDLHVLEVPESQRAAYHAGAVLSAGGVVALLSAAVEALGCAGIPADEALTALLPLTRSGGSGHGGSRACGGPHGPHRPGRRGHRGPSPRLPAPGRRRALPPALPARAPAGRASPRPRSPHGPGGAARGAKLRQKACLSTAEKPLSTSPPLASPTL